MIHILINTEFPFSFSFFFFTGGAKKGTDHIIQSVKHVKSTGAIISMNMDPSSMHLAVGSDQGHVR